MIDAKQVMLTDIKNAMVRDKGLRAKNEAYWRTEEAEMSGILQEKDIVSEVNRALAIIDVGKLTEVA